MADTLNEVKHFFEGWSAKPLQEMVTLRQAGSNRQYFRAHTRDTSFILTYNPNNVPENNAFIEFAKHFYNKKLAVPEILVYR